MAQIRCVGLAQVFRHALTVGQEHEGQLVTNEAIDHRTNLCGFIGLGNDGTNERFLRFILRGHLMHQDHIFLGSQIGGTAHHQNTFEGRRAF